MMPIISRIFFLHEAKFGKMRRVELVVQIFQELLVCINKVVVTSAKDGGLIMQSSPTLVYRRVHLRIVISRTFHWQQL